MTPEWFPIMPTSRPPVEGEPVRIRWALVAPHEAQALANHSQTLARLAERGGLGAAEMVAVLEDRRWLPMRSEVAICRLRELVEAGGKPT